MTSKFNLLESIKKTSQRARIRSWLQSLDDPVDEEEEVVDSPLSSHAIECIHPLNLWGIRMFSAWYLSESLDAISCNSLSDALSLYRRISRKILWICEHLRRQNPCRAFSPLVQFHSFVVVCFVLPPFLSFFMSNPVPFFCNLCAILHSCSYILVLSLVQFLFSPLWIEELISLTKKSITLLFTFISFPNTEGIVPWK